MTTASPSSPRASGKQLARPADTSEGLEQYQSPIHRSLRSIVRKVLMRPVIKSVVDLRVEGEDNVADLDGAFIVVGNHSSHLDAPTMFTSLPDHISRNLATGAAADYFYRRKIISKLTALFFNSYPIDRTPKTKRGKKHRPGMTARLLANGIPIMIFPEGTRSRTGEIKKFNPGAAHLAQKAGIPVLPVALVGCHDAMPVGLNFPKAGRPQVRVLIGKPMRCLPGEDVKSFSARIEKRVRTMHEMRTPYILAPDEAAATLAAAPAPGQDRPALVPPSEE